MTGIHEVAIRKYEQNKVIPKKEQLEKIAHALGIAYNSLIDMVASTE